MQRISSTSPHKIQPHQKDTLNHKQKLLAKRAAAKVVRRKINESQQLSKSNINTTQVNQTQSEQPSKIISPTATSNNQHVHQNLKAHLANAGGSSTHQQNSNVIYQQNHYPRDMLTHSTQHGNNNQAHHTENNVKVQQYNPNNINMNTNFTTNHSTNNTDVPQYTSSSNYQNHQPGMKKSLYQTGNNSQQHQHHQASTQMQTNAQGSSIGTPGIHNNNTRLTSNMISQNQSQNATGVFSQASVHNSVNVNKINTKVQNHNLSSNANSQSNRRHLDQHEEEKHLPSMKGPNNQHQNYQNINQQQYNSNKTNYATNPQHQNSESHYNNQQIETHTQARHKPTQSYISGVGMSNHQQEGVPRGQENGEKMLNKRHQMRLTSGDSKRTSTHNITRSLIDEGSEDFTNIEEKLQEDTKISCRNAVASSLNNVSQMIKHVQQQQNLRNRRGTTQSNRSGPSNQPSKEETFESSSFFDEGVSQKLGNQYQQQNQQNHQGSIISPHRCNQVEGYNLPTIFNTLMFGIDQSKVSDNIRESFSNLSSKGRPSSQYQNKQSNQNSAQYQKKLSNKFAANQVDQQKQQSQQKHINSKQQQQQPGTQQQKPKQGGGISSLVTKVDKISSPIMVFDQSSQQNQPRQNQQTTRNQTTNNGNNAQQKSQQNKSRSPNPIGRQSQLKLAAHQNLKIEQHVEAVESVNTEMLNSQGQDGFQNRLAANMNQQLDTDTGALNQFEEQQDEEEEETVQNVAAGQIEDFQSSELHRNHLIQTLQSLQYIKTLPPVNKNEIKSRTIKLPAFKKPHIKKTLIFDLDETLVHCIDDIENNPCDEIINVTFPNGETVQAGINVRPYALECLKKANENYQVVVFTASHKAYADVVLDSLDPDRSLIQYRLYREHCIRTEEGIYIKDLRIISNRNLKDVIIVDNAVYSFGYQLDNGIPIIPFYDDKSDEELMHLIFYFNCLAQCNDVREQNRKAFQLKDLQEIDIAEYLQSMMNNNNNKNQQNNDEEEEQ